MKKAGIKCSAVYLNNCTVEQFIMKITAHHKNMVKSNLFTCKSRISHNGIFFFCLFVCFFSGLLSEKPDDSLFFLDVGQPKKDEQNGKYVITQFK